MVLSNAPSPRRPRLQAAIWFAVPALAIGALLHGLARPRIAGDGFGYFAPAASVLFEGDLDLADEIAPVGPALLRAMFLTPEGRLGDPFPVGPAILWTPALALAKRLPPGAAAAGGVTRNRHPAFAPRFAAAVLATDIVLVALCGGVLAVALAAEVAPWIAGLAVAASVFGTPTVFYVLAEPSYGHAAAYAAVALLLASALADRRRRLPLVLLGATWGFATLVRWQDAVLGVLLAPRLLAEWSERRSTGARFAAALQFLVPALVVFTPQLLFWWRIYGTPLLRPPGAEFVPWWRPQILPLLASTWNGAFLWSPLLVAGCIGWWWQPDRRLRATAVAGLALEIYVCARVQDWWGGGSIGARRLVSVAPLAAVGLALLFDRVHRRAVARYAVRALAALLVVAACAWNIRMGQSQLRGLLPFNPGSAADYVRWYAPGAPQARRYGLWDYPRLASDIAAAERMRRIRRHP